MTVAVCYKCGSIKHGAFNACPACSTEPADEDALILSLALSDHYLDRKALDSASETIKAGKHVELDPASRAKFAESLKSPQFQAFLSIAGKKHQTTPNSNIKNASPIESKVVDRERYQYINPFSLLSIDNGSAKSRDQKIIKQHIKKLTADIELSDTKAIAFMNVRISKSDLHDILLDLDAEDTYNHHLAVFENDGLLSFLHTSRPSFASSFELPEDRSLLSFLYPYLAFSFANAITFSLSEFAPHEWQSIFAHIAEIPSSFHDTILLPVTRVLRNVLDDISKLQQSVDNETISGIKEVPQLLTDAIEKRIPLAAIEQLQAYSSDHLSQIAGKIRSLSVNLHNDASATDTAIKTLQIAIQISSDPLDQTKFTEDLQKLRALSAEAGKRERDFRTSILSFLDSTLSALRQVSRENIASGKLHDNFAEVFSKSRMNAIVTDTDEPFCKSVEDKVWSIISCIGYENSKLILPVFSQLFGRTSDSKSVFDARLKILKREQTTHSLKSSGLKLLRAFSPFIAIGVLLGLGFVCEQLGVFNSGSSSSKTTTSAPSSTSPLAPQSTSGTGQEEYVNVGQYRCTRYHSTKLDKIRPSTILNSQIESDSRLLKSESAEIESEQVLLESVSSEIDILSSELKSTYVDQSDQSSIDEYNTKVDEYNTKLQEYRNAVASHNLKVSTHRTRVADHTEKLNRYNSQVDIYNNYLESNCTKAR